MSKKRKNNRHARGNVLPMMESELKVLKRSDARTHVERYTFSIMRRMIEFRKKHGPAKLNKKREDFADLIQQLHADYQIENEKLLRQIPEHVAKVHRAAKRNLYLLLKILDGSLDQELGFNISEVIEEKEREFLADGLKYGFRTVGPVPRFDFGSLESRARMLDPPLKRKPLDPSKAKKKEDTTENRADAAFIDAYFESRGKGKDAEGNDGNDTAYEIDFDKAIAEQDQYPIEPVFVTRPEGRKPRVIFSEIFRNYAASSQDRLHMLTQAEILETHLLAMIDCKDLDQWGSVTTSRREDHETFSTYLREAKKEIEKNGDPSKVDLKKHMMTDERLKEVVKQIKEMNPAFKVEESVANEIGKIMSWKSDFDVAYDRLPVRDPKHTRVSYYSFKYGRIRIMETCYTSFGNKNSVFTFSRFSRFVRRFAARGLLAPVREYIDDCIAPDFADTVETTLKSF